MKRYCTQCNEVLQKATVDGRETVICPQCNRVEGGYIESERVVVTDLQASLKNQLWRVVSILSIFRRHYQQKED